MTTTQATTPTVAIIGAGLGGIAAAVNLKRAGIESFTIFEQSAGPGGTWWDNTYPGAECDIDILFYSYSFQPHDWTRTHASQREIQAYVQTVIDRFELAPRMRYNTRIAEAIWDDQQHAYDIKTAGGEALRFDVVISAVGLLNVPRYPDWPGLETLPDVLPLPEPMPRPSRLDFRRAPSLSRRSPAASRCSRANPPT